MRHTSRTSQRLSRVLVLDNAIDARTEAQENFLLMRSKQRASTLALARCDGLEEHVATDIHHINLDADLLSLTPRDKGYRAYLFLFSAFIIEAIMWGFPLTSGGVFLSFYTSDPTFKGNGYITVIGTLGTGIPFLGAPIIAPLTVKWHRYQPQMIWTGWTTCIISLVAASFAKTVWQLILTQGLGYGIGFLILYYPVLSMINEWFIHRRGLAYGILFAAAGLSGTGLPPFTQYLLHQLGYPNTLRLFALSMFVLVGPTLPFCRGRLLSPTATARATAVAGESESGGEGEDGSGSGSESAASRMPWKSTLTNPVFYMLSLSNFFQGLSFYLPFFYIVMYAASLGVGPTKAVMLFCVLNLCQVASQIALGWLSDVYNNVFVLLVLSNAGSALCGILWLKASGFTHLAIFAALYGLLAGGYTVLVSKFVTTLTTERSVALSLYGILAFQRGVGNIAIGPLATLFISIIDKGQIDKQKSGYRLIICFVGASLLAAALGGFGYFWPQYTVEGRRKEKEKLEEE